VLWSSLLQKKALALERWSNGFRDHSSLQSLWKSTYVCCGVLIVSFICVEKWLLPQKPDCWSMYVCAVSGFPKIGATFVPWPAWRCSVCWRSFGEVLGSTIRNPLHMLTCGLFWGLTKGDELVIMEKLHFSLYICLKDCEWSCLPVS
jgi:hypothetical protein